MGTEYLSIYWCLLQFLSLIHAVILKATPQNFISNLLSCTSYKLQNHFS